MTIRNLICVWILFTTAVFAVDDKAAKIDEVMKAYDAAGKLNGVVLVADQGKIIYAKGFGYANFEWQVPNTPDAKFRIGSVTKPFTALLTLQEVKAGKIKLDAHVSDYLPEYRKDTGSKVTIRHLLTHTSGIPTYVGDQIVDLTEMLDRPAFTKRLCSRDLEWEPGTKFGYNNCGYLLLGEILERVSGKTYGELLRENITGPLGMKDTGVDRDQLLLDKRASGYDKNYITGIAPARNTELSWAFGAGDMYSTVNDLFLFDQALYTDKLLPADLRGEMFKMDSDGRPASLGWFVSKAANDHPAAGDTIVAHEGNIFGFFTMMTRIPERKALVIVIDNTHLDEFPAITRDALAVLYGKQPSKPQKLAISIVGPTIQREGVAAGIAQYKRLKSTEADVYEFPGLNELGRNLIAAGRFKEAVEMFKFSAEENPKSWWAIYGLAQAQFAAGQREEAKASCKKVLEMSPKNIFALYLETKFNSVEKASAN